jgi:sporulation integral membrane protein YtvI
LALIALTAAVVWRIIYELTALARDMPTLLSELSAFVGALRDRIRVYITSAPFEMQDYFQNALDAFANASTDFISAASGWLLGFITSAASFSPRVVIFVFTCAISTYFISSGYSKVTAFIMRQMPEEKHKAVREFRTGLVRVFGKWFKAEAMLSGAAFIQLLTAFLILRIQFAIVLALIIAVIDLIPMIGVGSVLVPWALVSLITGNFIRAVTLVVTFGVIAVVRNILEPKLVGGQIGLPPIATLLAMYIGFSAIGVIGMALFPIGLVVLKQINDRGYIHLWK